MKNGSDNESEEIVEGDELLDESLPLMVWLSCAGNVDFRQDPSRPLPGVPSGFGVAVSCLLEARETVLRYLGEHQLGGGNWTGGQVYRAGELEPFAEISYNGRVWRLAAASPAARP